MKKIIVTVILLIPFLNINSQEIGELAPPKKPMSFPPNAWGFDLMIGESGFGLGGFYHQKIDEFFTFFSDISFSESKDEQEFDYVDIFGQTYTLGKKNRIFQIPINFGVQYRLFTEELTDNLRPYLSAGIGPSLVITTPYSEEFFKSFSYAKLKIAAGGYIGFGANFGIDTSNLVGLTFRYYYIRLFGNGVESISDRPKKTIGGFFITINFGFMY